MTQDPNIQKKGRGDPEQPGWNSESSTGALFFYTADSQATK